MSIELDPRVEAFVESEHGMFIDGDLGVRAVGGAVLPVQNPATGRAIATIPAGDSRDVQAAVDSAREAHVSGAWRRISPHVRGEILWRLADLIERDATLLAQLDSLDVGTPIAQTPVSPAAASRTLRFYAGWCNKVYGSVNPVDPSMLGYTAREPVGVVAGIGAWNSPLVIAASKSGPALAGGNTVVLKPAEQAPLSTLWFARLAKEAGIPDGVVNIVTGAGLAVGAPLAEHPDVRLVSFTGSQMVGQDIHSRATSSLSDVVLELGGKSAFIVFPDADVEAAAQQTARSMRSNSAQVCYTGSRVLVHRSVAERFVAEVVRVTGSYSLGPGLDPATDIGPLVSAAQQSRVMSYIDLARAAGADFALGGIPDDRPGYFVPPSLLLGVDNAMAVVREEIFGPVIAVMEFETEDEAVAIANDSPFGLAAGIWTNDLARAHRVAALVEAGVVWVNTYGVLDRSAPWGGVKLSGMAREHGTAWIEHFTRQKTVYVNLGSGVS
jgi:acyl-CoA reductase-like NAD-dependent aldehyde dehydrogenase